MTHGKLFDICYYALVGVAFAAISVSEALHGHGWMSVVSVAGSGCSIMRLIQVSRA